MTMEKKFLTVKDTADYLGVSQKTVRRMIDDNQIAFLMIRGSLRIAVKNLEGWIDKKTIPAKRAA